MFRWFHRLRKNLKRSTQTWRAYLRYCFFEAAHRTSKSFRSLRRVSEKTADDLHEGLKARPQVLARNFFNPVFWLLQSAAFLLRLLISRRATDLLMGVPAMLGMAAPVVLSVWIAPDHDSLVARARNRTSQFIDEKDYEKADFFCRRWTTLAPDDETAILRRAQVLDLLERPDQATELLILLAERRRYLPAMLVLCRREMQQVFSANPPDRNRVARLEASLQALLNAHPGNTDGNFMLATVYLNQNKLIEALELFQSITQSTVGLVPDAWYSQAVLQVNLGRFNDARASATVAADQFIKQHVKQPAGNDDLIKALRSLIIAQREEEALAMVDSRIRISSDQQELGQWYAVKGDICAAWSRRLRSRPNASSVDHARSLAVLFEGIKVAPSQDSVVEELCALAISDRISSQDVGQHLQTALNSGVSPGLVHFIQGTRYATQTPPDSIKADEQFQLAVAHDANFPGLLNNMANLISNSSDGNHAEALKLVEEALRQIPRQPQFLDTRGKLLLRLGKPQQALVDFEQALIDPSTRAEVHTNIAAAWKSLGNSEKAAYHQALADALLKATLPK